MIHCSLAMLVIAMGVKLVTSLSLLIVSIKICCMSMLSLTLIAHAREVIVGTLFVCLSVCLSVADLEDGRLLAQETRT